MRTLFVKQKFLTVTLAMLLPGVLLAQAPAPQPPAPAPQPPAPGAPTAGAPQAQIPVRPPVNPNKPKPYEEVITKEAKTDDGLFKIHQIEDRYFVEIPKNILGKEVLWVSTLERSQAFYGFGQTEVRDRVLRFEKRGDKILVREVSYDVRANGSDTERSLAKGNVEAIVSVFDIKAYGPNESVVLDFTTTFISPELSNFRFDPTKTFVDSVKSYPTNIEVKITGTQPGTPVPPQLAALGLGGPAGPNTVVAHHSIVLLPEKPMMPRLYDSRVGFFATGFTEIGDPENRVKDKIYIDRWRLEKKDPTAALSEPVKPIIYYLGAEIPKKWKPYVKKGVEAWSVVFEKAGFRNAVQCRDIPTPQEDPDFDQEDVRYTVIKWLPSGVENAYGPHLSDPRTGEILNGSPKIFHNILNLVQNWYFVQASASDARARRLPFSDELTGDLLAYVVTHEVGHTLGFAHNMKASSSYTVAQLRDPKFTKEWGTEASIMDYGRNNYIAQPEDGVKSLMPKIGPYDFFAVEWGYKPIDGARTPEQEKSALDKIASRQIDNPMLRFGNASNDDPGRQTEDLSDDPVEAGRLGLKNIDRVLNYLVQATTTGGDDYEFLSALYSEVIGQRAREMGHVATTIGGVTETNYHARRGKDVNYVPVSAAKQRAAAAFLIENNFKTPFNLIKPEIIGKLQASGAPDIILSTQQRVLNGMLSEVRLRRLVEQEARLGKDAFTASELFTMVRKGAFTELTDASPKVDLYRRNLQRAYINTLGIRLGTTGESRPLARQALKDARASMQGAMTRVKDTTTKSHFEDLVAIIDELLMPKTAVATGGTSSGSFSFPFATEPTKQSKWQEYPCFLPYNLQEKWLETDK
jgi:hypothetical protein